MNAACLVWLAVVLLASGCTNGPKDGSWQSQYVKIAENGTLVYAADSLGNRIPDFSHVGYGYGDAPLPGVPVAAMVRPAPGDDGPGIQAVIDSLARLPAGPDGFRGAILLREGVYEIGGTIRVHASGIVLRGEGQGDSLGRGGTLLVATGAGKRNLVELGGEELRLRENGPRVEVAETYVPVGRTHLVVEDGSPFRVGDLVVIHRPGTAQWIRDIGMDRIPPRPEGDRPITQWSPEVYSLDFERVLVKVSGDTLHFRNPIVMPLEARYGGGQVVKVADEGRIRQVGVENLHLRSEFAHDEDEDHGWNAIYADHVEHGWVRDITARHFGYSAVNLEKGSKHMTVHRSTSLDPVSIVTGSRRYSFNNDGQMNLVMECRARRGRHDFVTGARIGGPNVFMEGVAELAYNDIGPHQRWASGVLYDRIVTDGELNVQNRVHRGSGHGWSGINHVVWNSKAATAVVQSPQVSGTNYMIGFQGEKATGFSPESSDGIWEGHNRPGLTPSSLYRAQLQARGGSFP